MGYKIVGDSCTELSEELIGKLPIQFVPLTLQVNGLNIIDDETFDQAYFLEEVRKSKDGPKSACPSPSTFMHAYEGPEERVYCITLSQHLSGSYNSASLGKTLYYEEHEGSTKKIAVFSSDSACCGQGVVALKIAELEAMNLSFEDICDELADFIWDLDTFFVLETLDSLKKNGRLTGFAAIVATVMNIKPFMGEDHGVIIKIDQARGIKKSLNKMIDYVCSHVVDPEDKVLGISHCNCPERAEYVKNAILERVPFKDVFIANTRGVGSCYAADGGVVVAY